jgi:hypothetical protein
MIIPHSAFHGRYRQEEIDDEEEKEEAGASRLNAIRATLVDTAPPYTSLRGSRNSPPRKTLMSDA